MQATLVNLTHRVSPSLVARAVCSRVGATAVVAPRYFSTHVVKETPHMEREVQGGLNAEQLLVLDKMFGKLDNLETEVRELRAKLKELGPTFAVDAPDGDSLGHELEEKLEVDHIIEEAALHEDKKHVEKVHKLEEDVKKFHARDPEHDW